MLNHDLVLIHQFDDALELYSNAYYYGYKYIAYYKEPYNELITKVEIDDAEYYIEGLQEGVYYFYCMDEYDNKTNPVKVKIYGKSTEDYLLDQLDEEYNQYMVSILEEDLSRKDLIPSIYKKYITLLEEDPDDDNIRYLKSSLETLIEHFNNIQTHMNVYTDDFRIYISKEHVLMAVSNNDEYFTDNCSIIINKFENDDWIFKRKSKIVSEQYITRLEEGLYKLEFYKEDCLMRAFYFYSDNLDISNEKYREILEELKIIANKKISAISNLPSDWEFESEKEEAALVNLYSITDDCVLFERPIIRYINGMLRIRLTDIYPFISVASDIHEYFVYAVTEKEIYKPFTSAIMIRIKSDNFEVDPWEYFFKEEPYYFYVADENNKRISRVTYEDLSETIYYNEDFDRLNEYIDYNNSYQRAMWNQYVNNLHSVIYENMKEEIWPAAKKALDSILSHDNIAYNSPKSLLLKQVLDTWNEKYGTLIWMIYYIFMCDYRYYTKMNRQFMKYQSRIDGYRLHEIPCGDYILHILRIKDDKVEHEWRYDTNNTQSFRIDSADYILFWCINPDDYSVSDFGYYNNTKYGTNYKYNSLEIEVR